MTEKVKVIRIDAPAEAMENAWGVSQTWPVHVDWFPPLTMDQHAANGVARAEGRDEPYPDPNLIYVTVNTMRLWPYQPVASGDFGGTDAQVDGES